MATGDFGDRRPRKPPGNIKLTPENWLTFQKVKEAIAEQAIKRAGAKLEVVKLLVLVDLQGIYLGLHRWLTEKNFPIDGGLVLSRFAFFQIHDVFERIKSQHISGRGRDVFGFERLVAEIEGNSEKASIRVLPEKTYIQVEPLFELFYAPAPLDDIEWHLRQQARKGSMEAQGQLEQVSSGVLRYHQFERDYAAYGDFVSKLKANPQYSRSEQGFFSYYVGPRGLKVFDEKEVDARMVIRAMDAFYNYEADLLCIVSSDQDFMPLHEKSQEFGVQTFQADLANFQAGRKTGRRLKSLGHRFLPGRIDPMWPLQIITEAVSSSELGHSARYSLTRKEFTALCELSNEINNFKITLSFLPNGKATMEVTR